MDLNLNYYAILGVQKIATISEIKKAYYQKSKESHPDKKGDNDIFVLVSEAYTILSNSKDDYDKKSVYGANYDESLELLSYDFDNSAKIYKPEDLENFKKNSQLNIVVYIDDTFDGSVEFERYVICKKCGGDGKDTSSKIQIKDENGNVIKMFDGSDGCDFCEGSGKDWKNNECYFCGGKGKVGWSDCHTCNGEKRILGNQKLTGIKIPKDSKSHKIESMGHSSKEERGRVGHLWLVYK